MALDASRLLSVHLAYLLCTSFRILEDDAAPVGEYGPAPALDMVSFLCVHLESRPVTVNVSASRFA